MTRFPLINIILIAVLSLSLTGCATVYNPATGKDEIIFIDTESEIAIGESAVSQIGEKYKLSDNKDDLDRLKRIGMDVAQASDRKDLKYKFYLIEDKDINAFTIPGGHVYVFRGLYDILDDDELACVIGHELGHVAARHIVKRLQATLGYQILSTIALVTYTKGRDENKKKAAYIAYAGSTAFNLVSLGYSRQDECQADTLGVKYARNSGFNPYGMITSLEKLKEKEEKGLPVPYMLRSHPYLEERIARLKGMI